MKPQIINYFHFSRNERLGTFALLTFCVLAFSTPTILQWLRPQTKTDFSEFEATIQSYRQSASASVNAAAQSFDFDPNLATAGDFIQLGLSEKVAQNICRYREKGGTFRKPEDFQKIWHLQAEDYARLLPYIHISTAKNGTVSTNKAPEHREYFPFDPNTVTAAEMSKLGLQKNTIKSIVNYREKGGVFRKKEDLAKIYTLSKVDYNQLESYISISTSSTYANNLQPTSYTSSGASNYYPTKTTGPIDINTATVETWKTLPMIGEGRAKQLVKFREKLGGFVSIQQVAELYNLPDSVYQRIKPQLQLHAPKLYKININTVSPENLRAHPYISWKQADLIIAYRSQHGQFASIEDILKIKAFTDSSWWQKVSPYLSVE